ncbi:MAG TPA: hypothetical protein DCS66_18755, partial [Flavobacteriaceae bacterium]|nr:hypothetical protein [Flavobacteriaceae bacterium]
TASQTLTIIPREYLGSFYVKIRDTSLNKTFTYLEDTTTTSGNYLSFTGNYVDDADVSIFIEGRFYDLDAFADYNYWNTNLSLWETYDEDWQTDSDKKSRVYKDTIFCTDQDIDQNDSDYYDLNKDQYVTNDSFNNEYIVV